MNPPNLEINFIVLLLPIAAALVVFQVNPYHTLILRGMLGAIAALVYTVSGAPDVALTEALVGTLLAITLYAVAVRSSLVLRLGILEGKESELQGILADLRPIMERHYLRLEIVPYSEGQALESALAEKEIHAICSPEGTPDKNARLAVRVRRIYDILEAELRSPETILNHVEVTDAIVPQLEKKHL